jgi:hypothetical protein
MTAHPIRFFADDEAIRRVGEGLLARTLPKSEWTHEAHLAAILWLIRDRPDIDVDADIAGIISNYNVATGVVNDASHGYHETITRCYLDAARKVSARLVGLSLADTVNQLLSAPEGRRDWPLRLYSRERLMSAAARRAYLPPDL